MSTHTNALIIFIKNPELGRCKTRLAATVGDEKALEVYKNLLAHTRRVTCDIDVSRYLFYDKNINPNDDWKDSLFIKSVQSNGDLGDRMQNAFDTVLNTHDKVIIIGSDCPELNSSVLDKAFNALEENDLVIGPTHDGGYYLLGMKKASPFLFNEMEWSVDSVFNSTVERIKKENKTYFVLETLSDLDNEDDLKGFPEFG
ncbi:MAG: glycosyltransferase [Saprospiraceae bacterium]|nr:TIGR04282 family arsenosugar biosynthesis glycosyltransferase [Bacteroidia bacterium]NNE13861.1 glycosyltransferase [Saprospiraceae bacterium]NNL91789.1 glycosyltransferase [Saprospiraceae bacterium]